MKLLLAYGVVDVPATKYIALLLAYCGFDVPATQNILHYCLLLAVLMSQQQIYGPRARTRARTRALGLGPGPGPRFS